MKRVLSILILIALVSYVAFAAIVLCRKPTEQLCQGVRLEIRDSLKTGYMTTNDIAVLLAKQSLDPNGKPLDAVDLQAMEDALKATPLIASCECYKTIGGHVMVSVECRKPILRIITHAGESYYLDEEGEAIAHIAKAVYLPIATGHITLDFAKEKLLPLAQLLQDDKLWDTQIEQIHVTPRQEIELVPRVGGHIIALGRPEDYAQKLDNLHTFYEKALKEVGWDRYSRISLDHQGQVVATKKEQAKR